jgi:hypothetical protein
MTAAAGWEFTRVCDHGHPAHDPAVGCGPCLDAMVSGEGGDFPYAMPAGPCIYTGCPGTGTPEHETARVHGPVDLGGAPCWWASCHRCDAWFPVDGYFHGREAAAEAADLHNAGRKHGRSR